MASIMIAQPADRPERPRRTSELLRVFAQSRTEPRVSVDEIVTALGDRGLGVLIAIFALPNILPSTVPFGNVLTGIPVVVFAVQLMLGVEHVVLPGILARRTITTPLLQSSAPRVAGLLSWFERLLKPRLSAVTGPRAERLVGVLCTLLSIVSTLPIPFAHNLPALGLMLIGLGLIEHDGVAIATGAAIGMVGVILLALALFAVATGMHHIHWHALEHALHLKWR